MVGEQSGYQAYMLRLWLAGCDGERVWRVSLENAHTGAREVFVDLQALFAYLEEIVAEQDVVPGPADTSDD